MSEYYLPILAKNARRSTTERDDGLPAATVWERAALWGLVAVLAWVQFPLGSNRSWSWSLLVLLIAADWLLWIPFALGIFADTTKLAKRLALPGLIFAGVLLWAWYQSLSISPAAWHNPIWQMAGRGLGKQISGAISIDPFKTTTEAMKLASYVAFGWLAATLALRPENARVMLVAVFATGVAYAVYGMALTALGTSQLTLLEGVDFPGVHPVAGGFVSKNSFATFTGLSLLAGLTMLVEAGRHRVVTVRGWRTHLRTFIQFAFGPGTVWLVGSIVLVAALVASNSRAGFVATLVGLSAMFVIAILLSSRKGNLKWTLLGGMGALAGILLFFLVNGHGPKAGFESLIETAGSLELRPVLWGAAVRAIQAHPFVGTGLGTYGDAYHLYANGFVPFVVDRVHNDYLEFALGVGLPAATTWIIGLLILCGLCARGALTRRRRRGYALTAVGATALVGFHSLFDFSLQIPADAVLYAVIMGIGLGQAWPSGTRSASASRGAP